MKAECADLTRRKPLVDLTSLSTNTSFNLSSMAMSQPTYHPLSSGNSISSHHSHSQTVPQAAHRKFIL